MSRITDKLIVIVGETASGKSSLALQLAQQYNGEILSADSWAVYKGFDIGTAKPSILEQQKVPHHLIDIADARKGFSAARFKRLADKAITEIHERGRLPILVGGTGLYVDAVIYDYGFLKKSNEQQRTELNERSLEELVSLARERGLDIDAIDTTNKRRVIRLIENNGALPTKSELRPGTLVIGLLQTPELRLQRITQRVDAMFAAGLETEVRQLSQQYGWSVEPMKGVGYKEFEHYFLQDESLESLKERIIRSTHQLAKKQRTWFGRNKDILWVEDSSGAKEQVEMFLNN